MGEIMDRRCVFIRGVLDSVRLDSVGLEVVGNGISASVEVYAQISFGDFTAQMLELQFVLVERWRLSNQTSFKILAVVTLQDLIAVSRLKQLEFSNAATTIFQVDTSLRQILVRHFELVALDIAALLDRPGLLASVGKKTETHAATPKLWQIGITEQSWRANAYTQDQIRHLG